MREPTRSQHLRGYGPEHGPTIAPSLARMDRISVARAAAQHSAERDQTHRERRCPSPGSVRGRTGEMGCGVGSRWSTDRDNPRV